MGLVVTSLALYGAGLTSTLSPCVLPLVPGYLGILVDTDRRAHRVVRVALFAVGAAATFVALGGVVAAAGLGVGTTVGRLQRVAGLSLIGLGMLMVLGRRGALSAERRLIRHLPAQAHLRALLLGVGCGAAWSPCVGPLLGVALTAAGATGSVGRGSVLLATFALGVLTPFLAFSALPLRARPPARLVEVGRRLGAVTSVVAVLLGLALAAGWYDGLVQRLPVGG